ncbi:MAG TPA: hypothetical protein VIL74_07910 [Pyrinomonadaceae bacterium]|jgi:hypothetical protein
MKHSAIILVFVLLLAVGRADAQKAPSGIAFTSRYTNLDTDCRTLAGRGGTDDAYQCRGVGGYRMYVGYSALSTIIKIYARNDESVGDIPMQSLDFDQTKIKVEWRLANGKPFAVIIRLYKYGEDSVDEFNRFGKKVGEELKIVGLKGFEDIDFTVDANAPDANAKARELADDAFREKQTD